MRRYGGLLGLALALGVVAWLARPDARVRPQPQSARALSADRMAAAPAALAATPGADAAAVAAADDDSPAMLACTAAYRDALRAQLESRAAGADARTQLIAAALAQRLYGDDPEEADVRTGTALARARELAPDDALVAWTAAGSCYPQVGCDRLEALDHLLQVEADNGAAWLFALAEAALRQDQASIDAALAAAARAPRYDSHFGDLPLAAMEWMRAVPYPRECHQAASEWGDRLGLARPATQADHVALVAVPMLSVEPLSGIVRVCRPDDAAASTQHVRDCVAVYTRMAGSDTLVARRIALRMLVQYTADQADGVQWRERLRAQEWLMEQGLRLPRAAAGWAAGQFTLGEVPMLQATLERSGRWPPPAGWLPRNPRDRALVTTGRPPSGMR